MGLHREWEGIRLMTDPVSLNLASIGTNKSELNLIYLIELPSRRRSRTSRTWCMIASHLQAKEHRES